MHHRRLYLKEKVGVKKRFMYIRRCTFSERCNFLRLFLVISSVNVSYEYQIVIRKCSVQYNQIDVLVSKTTTFFFFFLFAIVPDGLPYYYYIYSSPQMEYRYCKLFNMTCVKVILQAVTELLPFILTGTDL